MTFEPTLVTAAQVSIVLVGLSIVIVGALGIRSPRTLSEAMTRWIEEGTGFLFAISGFALIGVLFIYAADQTRVPALFLTLGFLSLIGAAALPFLGRQRMLKLIALITGWGEVAMRAWLAVGMLAGLLIAYGAGLAPF